MTVVLVAFIKGNVSFVERTLKQIPFLGRYQLQQKEGKSNLVASHIMYLKQNIVLSNVRTVIRSLPPFVIINLLL